MVLSVNREIGIQPNSNIIASKQAGIIKGDELTTLAREILTGSPSRKAAVNTADVKIFTQGADVNSVKQVATNLTGYNVFLSQDALNAINALKANAAQTQAQNLSKVVDGKIHINGEQSDIFVSKSANSGNVFLGMMVSESANTDKDRKGPGGIYVPFEKEEEEENKKSGINLLI